MAEAGARLTIASHFPGRLRVRAAPFRDPAFAAEVAEHLCAEAGVVSATTASRTGSLLIVYDARALQLPGLVQLVVRLGKLEGLEVDHDGRPTRSGPVIREMLDRWNGAIIEASRGRLDTKTAVPGTLAGLGVLKLLFGHRRLPEWYDLLFWSFTTFVSLNPPNPPGPVSADGQSE